MRDFIINMLGGYTAKEYRDLDQALVKRTQELRETKKKLQAANVRAGQRR